MPQKGIETKKGPCMSFCLLYLYQGSAT